jgi:hypothetical protein
VVYTCGLQTSRYCWRQKEGPRRVCQRPNCEAEIRCGPSIGIVKPVGRWSRGRKGTTVAYLFPLLPPRFVPLLIKIWWVKPRRTRHDTIDTLQHYGTN